MEDKSKKRRRRESRKGSPKTEIAKESLKLTHNRTKRERER